MSDGEIYPVPVLCLDGLRIEDVGEMTALLTVATPFGGPYECVKFYLGGDDLTKLRNWLAAICGE